MNLHQRAVELAAQYKRTQSELLEIMQRIDEKKVYREHGASSLFSYATKVLGLCEHAAYSIITVARKSNEIPELKKEIAAGTITISSARRIASVITKENKEIWLERAKVLPQKKLEREIAKVNPKAAVRDQATYLTEHLIKLEGSISEETMQLLKRVQDLVSQQTKKAATLDDTLKAALTLFVERKDPVKLGARRVEALKKKVTSLAALKKRVLQRDQGQCSHIHERKGSGEQTRCEERRWLEIHHVLPKEFGGEDTLENLTTLCHAHHQHLHARLSSLAMASAI